jgi:Reverse transcriptase (RNA-dependent DNA polymerase)
MARITTGEPFGMDPAAFAAADWDLALKRVVHDLRSDFIYAPHLSFIYRQAGAELVAALQGELQRRSFSPGVPITIEVPKPFRIRVKARTRRPGPNYSRPGSILLPQDRLLYQAFADRAAPLLETRTDRTRSFSHALAPSDSATMFLPTRDCWNQLQGALKRHSGDRATRYVMKVDVANFFGSLNQHTLINELEDAGFPNPISSRLEVMLTRYTGQRSSRGILQGMYPSDLFGDYYLVPIDRFFSERSVPSARYVDDMIYLRQQRRRRG